MEPDYHDLKQTYQRIADEKLIRIATYEAEGLRPEAVQALREVIKERGLSDDISAGMEVQRQPIDEVALKAYMEVLRGLQCPVCGTTGAKLNGTVTGTVTSFIILTNYEKRVKIACPACLDKTNDAGTMKSIALGWWALPWGIIRTIQCILFNHSMKKQHHLAGPNETMVGFTLSNVGVLEAYKNDPIRLRDLITDVN